MVVSEDTMRTPLVVLAGLLASMITFPAIRAEATPAPRPDDTGIRLIGCLVKGDDGYLLTNLPSEPSTVSPAGSSIIPGAVGTTGVYSTIFYWLDDNDDLKHHVGHRVEVVGSLKGDPKNAEIRLRRYYAWTEMKVKSDGHSMKVLVPAALPAPYIDIDTKVSAVVRRVDVDYVFMLAVGC
jgi:hypothetical protein